MTPARSALEAVLLLAVPALPALLAAAWPVPGLRRWSRALAPWAAVPALALALLHLARPGSTPVLRWEGFATGLTLGLDGVGGALLLLTALLWTAAGAFARVYHVGDDRGHIFFAFFALTLSGNLAVVLAGDLLTFYLAFAVMTFSAYGLVVHRRDAEALRAGRIYLVLALTGEAALLAGLFSLGAAGGGAVGFGAELEGVWASLAAGGTGAPAGATLPTAPVVAALLAAGFSIKAGLTPLHLWLPLAHPVAPTAASALLSGSMLKAGLLGWLRVLPDGLALPAVGAALLVVGTATAFYGVMAGLAQDDPKTVLAYSSVSQMGYAGIGMGALLLLPPELSAPAVGALLLFALHHGMAKGALFLSVGLAGALPGGSGAHWARGVVLGVAAVPALLLTGFPLTSGALAKEALKEPLQALGGSWYAVLDPILAAAAGGTTLLMARFLVTLRAGMGGEGSPERFQGLVLPTAALSAAGLLAPLWLERALPGDLLPGVGPLSAAPLSALLPVLAGAALALAVHRRPGLLGPLRFVRIPPGDVVVLAEAALRRLPRPHRDVLEGAATRARTLFEATQEAVGRRLDDLDRRDLSLVRGVWLGLLLAGLAAAFLAAAALPSRP